MPKVTAVSEPPAPVSAEEAAGMLARSGLTGPAFDPEEVARTLAGWWEADARLDMLLEAPSPDDPVGFDPQWR